MSRLGTTKRSISPHGDNSTAVHDTDNKKLLAEILKELKIISYHLSVLTDEEITCIREVD